MFLSPACLILIHNHPHLCWFFTRSVVSSAGDNLEALGLPILADETLQLVEFREVGCTSICCDLTEQNAKVAVSYDTGNVSILELGEDVVDAMTFACSQVDNKINTMAMLPNPRLCRTDETYSKQHILVGTEAGIVTDWMMDRNLSDPCQWQAHSKSPLASGEPSGVSALSIGCNEFLSGGADGSLCFWSAGLRQGDRHVLRRILPAHRGAVTCVDSAGARQGSAFSAGQDGHVRYWAEESSAELPEHLRDLRDRSPLAPIDCMCVDRRLSRILAGSQDGYVRLWDTDVWRATKRDGHISARENTRSRFPPLTAVRFNTAEASYHEFVSAAADGSWCLWDLRVPSPVKGQVKDRTPLISVALNGARLLTCSKSSSLALWDLRSDKVLRKVLAMNFLKAQI